MILFVYFWSGRRVYVEVVDFVDGRTNIENRVRNPGGSVNDSGPEYGMKVGI